MTKNIISHAVNDRICEGLGKLARKYEIDKNRGKAHAYRRAIQTIKQMTEPVRCRASKEWDRVYWQK